MTLAKLFTDETTENSWSTVYGRVLEAFEEVSLLSTRDSVDLDDVLRLVGRRLCELLGASRCSVYLRREDGAFQGQVGYCAGRTIDAAIRKLVAGVDHDQFTAEIVNSAQPVIIRDAAHDPRTIQRTMRRWGVRDMLGVPLVVDSDVIGIIFVDNESEPHPYRPHDIQVAQAFAGLSALAVRQGWLYKRLADRAKIIDNQRVVLGESSLLHSRVTRAVLDGAEIDDILALISTLLDQPVVLYGPDLHVLSWSAPNATKLARSPGLTPEQTRTELVRDATKRLRDGEPSIMIRATPELRCRRLMSAMLVDRQCVGYLELCEIGRSFGQIDRRAVEQAAMALSLKMLATHRSVELRRQEKEAYFSDLIYARRDARVLIERAAEFGVDASRVHTLLRLQYDPRAHGRRPASPAEHGTHIDAVARGLGPESTVVSSTSIPGADLLLIETDPQVGGDSAGAVEAALEAAVARTLDELVERFDVRFAILSDTCRSIADLATAATKVRQLSGLLGKAPINARVVTHRQFDMLRLVSQRTGVSGATRFAEALLAPLIAYDAANNACLESTLRAFVEHDAQIRQAALALDVHENTVRYRLAKVREISGIAPDRLESLAKVVLALQVQDLAPSDS